MNAEQFIELVRKLRNKQKEYFRDRRQSDLITSKMIEKQVDQALLEGIAIPVEGHLEEFSDDAEPGEQIDLFE